MKWLACLLLALSVSLPCQAVSNRVIDDIGQLRELGFDFATSWGSRNGMFSFVVTAPRHFDTGQGGNKPLSGISFVQTAESVEHGPKLLGASGSRFRLFSWESSDGRHQSKITVLTRNATDSYIVVHFVRPVSGDWPMVIYVPVDSIIRQLEAEHADAPTNAP